MIKSRLAAAFMALAIVCPISAQSESIEGPIRLYTIDCGSIEVVEPNVFDRQDRVADLLTEGERNMVVPCYLIRHPKGDLLWDAGLPDDIAQNEGGVLDLEVMKFIVQNSLIGQLQEINLAPEDIEYLAVSHSHVDHAGNAKDFLSSTWLVNAAERAFTETEAAKEIGAYGLFDLPEETKVIEIIDDYDVFDDGTVRLIQTPGHSPGHMSLLLKLQNTGTLFLTGDLYHYAKSRENELVPDFNTDEAQTRLSFERFEALVITEQARVIIQHTQEDFDALPKFPAYAD